MIKKNSFLHESGDFFSWLKTISNQIISISHYRFFTSIGLSIISQLFIVLSFFLPLKVIFLLESKAIPSYLDDLHSFSSIEQLIFFLVFLSTASYFASVATNFYTESLSAQGARKVLASTSKMAIYQNQDELAHKSYIRIVNVFAGILSLVSTLIILSLIYTSFFYIISICIIISVVILQIKPNNPITNIHSYIQKLYGIFFLFVFSLMVCDLVLWSNINIYVALISLLLVRQLLQRLTSASIDGVLAYRDKERISKIFLSEKSNNEKKSDSITSILDHENSYHLVIEVLGKINPKYHKKEIVSINFFQSSIIDIILLHVETKEKYFIIKAFDNRHKMIAERERDLLTENSESFNFFYFYSFNFDKKSTHVFEFTNKIKNKKNQPYKEIRGDFFLNCIELKLKEKFKKRYLLSHFLIFERINSIKEALRKPIFDDVFDVMNLDKFIAKTKKHLENLPIILCPQDVTKDSLIVIKDRGVSNIHWERWSLEPVGFGLNEQELSILEIRKILDQSTISDVDDRKVYLSGLCGILEQKIKNQKYISAKSTVSSMIETLEILSNEHGL